MFGVAEESEAWPTELPNHEKPWASTASTSYYQTDHPSLHTNLLTGDTTSPVGADAECASGGASLQQEPHRSPGGKMHPATSKPCNKVSPDTQNLETRDSLLEVSPPPGFPSAGAVRCREGGWCHPCDFFWKQVGNRCEKGQKCEYCHDHRPTSSTPNRRQRKAGKRRVNGLLVWRNPDVDEPPLPVLPQGYMDRLRLSKAFEGLFRTIVLLAVSALELAASATMQQGATSEDVASDLEKISTMSNGILAEADLAPEAKGQLQLSETLVEFRGRMKELEDRVSWDGARRFKEDGDTTIEARLGDLEQFLSELVSNEEQYKEILANVAPEKLDDRWRPLEKKIELCAVEELKQNASRSSVRESVCNAFRSAALLPDAVEKVGQKLDKTPNLPAFVSDRNEIRKSMIKELDSSEDMRELLVRMRRRIDI